MPLCWPIVTKPASLWRSLLPPVWPTGIGRAWQAQLQAQARRCVRASSSAASNPQGEAKKPMPRPTNCSSEQRKRQPRGLPLTKSKYSRREIEDCMKTKTQLAIPEGNSPAPSSFSAVSAKPSMSAREPEILPPPGYAIARLADGRFAPLGTVPFQPDEPLASLFPLRWSADLIPQAQARHACDGDIIAFPTYQQALWWCQRRAETVCLLHHASVAALRSECYPERNIWYQEEIERLLYQAGYDWPTWPESRDRDGDEEKRESGSKGPFCIVEALDGCPRLLAWLELQWANERPRCPLSHLHVEAANLDELWVRLYEAVSTIIDRKCTKESRG